MSTQSAAYQSPEDQRKLQEQKLAELLRYVGGSSPFYMELFRKHGMDPSSIRTLEDLKKIPTTSKDDLQQRNWDFLCVDRSAIADYASTSGTLGSPVTIALTAADLDRLAFNEYASFVCAGGTAEDVYQLMLTLDRQFMAGIAYYSGLRKLGAGIIRLGPGTPAMQWDNIRRLNPTAVVAVPSILVKFIDYAQEQGIDVNATSVKKAICIGENIRNSDFVLNTLGKKIAASWAIDLYSTYASTEMQTAFTECKAGKGGHQQPELVIVELLDEEGRDVADGQPGEVTVTTLDVQGMPLLRYRTGDICIRHSEPCSCGRNSIRLSPVLGRKKQMIKLKGTTLYPPALFDLLNDIREIRDYVAEVSTSEMGTDDVLLYIFPNGLNDQNDQKIKAQLQARLRVIPRISYSTAEELRALQFPEGSRKARKFIDHRN